MSPITTTQMSPVRTTDHLLDGTRVPERDVKDNIKLTTITTNRTNARKNARSYARPSQREGTFHLIIKLFKYGVILMRVKYTCNY